MGRECIDLTGQRFGKLIAIKRIYPNSKFGNAMWLCKCDCGKEKKTNADNLRCGRTRSCGCLMSESQKLRRGVSGIHSLIGNYKRNAKRRGLGYNLTEEQFKELTQQDCYYCGVKPNNVQNIPHHYGNYIYNGLDRIDNSKGYTIDNVVPCCKICNMAKGTLTLQKFMGLIEKIYVLRIKKNKGGI